MPSRAPSACRRPGCSGLVRDGVCSVCGPLVRARQVEHDQRRGSARERGYDARWEKVRRLHLMAEPLCRMCGQAGRVMLASMVDHIVPIADGGAVLDDDNLQSLCRRCHDAKTPSDLARRRERG